MRWLWSSTAIRAHLLFLLVIGLLAWSLLTGNQGPANDYALGLVYCAIAYPVVLFLAWYLLGLPWGPV